MGLRELWLATVIISGIAFADGSYCRQLCEDKEDKVCLDGLPCYVTYGVLPPTKDGTPLPFATSLKVDYKCHAPGETNHTNLGLAITWQITGSLLGKGKAEEFLLTIRDVPENSEIPTAFVKITPNPTIINHSIVTFIYYYDDESVKEGPEITENIRYKITLKTVPIFYQSVEPDIPKENFVIPHGYIQRNCITSVTPNENGPDDEHQIMTTWLVIASVITVCLIVALVALTAFIWKRRQHAAEALNATRQHRILMLLNVKDKSEVAKQTNWTATAPSRVKKMGEVTVKYNRWETIEIADKGIMTWLHEKVTWADKIIISSTPDDQRNPENGGIFEQALDNILQEQFTLKKEKQIFIIHFKELEYYKLCPYVNNEKYRKFRLEEDWVALCRSIHSCPGSEYEPLHNGNYV